MEAQGLCHPTSLSLTPGPRHWGLRAGARRLYQATPQGLAHTPHTISARKCPLRGGQYTVSSSPSSEAFLILPPKESATILPKNSGFQTCD